MENLPEELHLKIMCFLDHKNLATAQLVCRKWKSLASEDFVWSYLFKERWGEDQASAHPPSNLESWKDVYEVQNRCDRFGRGVRIIREADKYYFIMQGKIQRYLGSRGQKRVIKSPPIPPTNLTEDGPMPIEMARGILDKILFFLGDMETAEADAKRARRAL